ncbi:MAG: aminomethyltransferase family protein [Chloroflexi bacterium]|nr:aminomethyltransferase family protein [Chloroflexota bacterium]
MPERRSPLYDIHLRTASQMVKGGGAYMFPLTYTSEVEEHINTRTHVGLQDLSSMGELDIKGPAAERLLSRLLVNHVYEMHPGQVRYSTLCNDEGYIIDDITIYKFSDEHFMLVTSSATRQKTADWVKSHAVGLGVYVTDQSAAVALLSVQGPRSLAYLKSVVQDVNLDRLRFFRFTNATINETRLVISRTGYTGELGYELYVPADEAAVLWEFITRTGREFGLRPYGAAAMQSLRIEKAFPLAGPDIDGSQTPFHVGSLHQYIAFTKREFVGREALLRWQDTGLDERWVGLELAGELPAKLGDPIYSVANISSFRGKQYSGPEAATYFDREEAGRVEVGRVTSSAKGHTVGKVLALGYVQVSHAWPGAKLLVNVGGRATLATIVPTPFFDPTGARLRAK